MIWGFQHSVDKDKNEPCINWYPIPELYNNIVSDTTKVIYWENYWYYRSGDDSKLIPDTLLVRIKLIPSLELLPEAEIDKTIYYFNSTMSLKYGLHDNSYNVINPKISHEIQIVNEKINLREIYERMLLSNKMEISFHSDGIPIKEILNSLNINIEDGSWNYIERGRPFALNQIIINSSFINDEGTVLCASEFILPVNGFYNDPNSGKWQY